jgi:hypothetical protein
VEPYTDPEAIVTAASSAQPGMAHDAGRVLGRALKAPWTTPRRLVAFRTVILVSAALLFFVAESALGRSRASLRTIGKDTAPSIIFLAQTGAALSNLDANVANALLGTAPYRATAEAAMEKQRVAATDSLVRSAENITNGDAERGAIGGMIVDLGRYLEGEAQAVMLHDRGVDEVARGTYLTATDLLHRKILAAADRLDSTKKSQMDAAFAFELEANGAAEFVAAGFGLLLLGSLVWTQWFLLRRTRRMINVPLLVATVAALGLTAYLIHAFSDTRENLRVAKLDAFDSIYALVRARSIAYDAEGDESRYLLDPSSAREADFRRKVSMLTADPALSSVAHVQIVSANPKTRGVRSQDKPTIQGMLWDELRNITFRGEYEAAVDVLTSFARYYAIDDSIRGLKAAGKNAEAIELAIGPRPDESHAAFDKFDQALQATLAINQVAFDEAIYSAEAELKRAEYVDPGLTLLIALAGWLGVRQRLREYQA